MDAEQNVKWMIYVETQEKKMHKNRWHKKVERWHVGMVSHFPGNPCEFKEPRPSSDCMLETHLVAPWLGLFLLGPLGLLQQRDLGAVLSQLCSLWWEEAQTMSSHLLTWTTSVIRTRRHVFEWIGGQTQMELTILTKSPSFKVFFF